MSMAAKKSRISLVRNTMENGLDNTRRLEKNLGVSGEQPIKYSNGNNIFFSINQTNNESNTKMQRKHAPLGSPTVAGSPTKSQTIVPSSSKPPTIQPSLFAETDPKQCDICSVTGEACCGTCVEDGNQDSRGCFECIGSIVDVQHEDGTDDQFMTCETPIGKSYKVKAIDKEFIRNNFGHGKFISGEVNLVFDADAMIDESKGEIDSNSPPKIEKKKEEIQLPSEEIEVPSTNPSSFPSILLSDVPSELPTELRSHMPTLLPSNLPSYSPSVLRSDEKKDDKDEQTLKDEKKSKSYKKSKDSKDEKKSKSETNSKSTKKSKDEKKSADNENYNKSSKKKSKGNRDEKKSKDTANAKKKSKDDGVWKKTKDSKGEKKSKDNKEKKSKENKNQKKKSKDDKRKTKSRNNGNEISARKLQTQVVGNCGTYLGGSCAGTRTVLVVRVIAVDKSTTASESELAENIFENANDSLNLQSWYKQCSYNQLNFVPATGDGINKGVTTVSVPSSSTDGDSVMNNYISVALNVKFSVTSPNQIADHIMFCLPPGTMKGLAYAHVNNWRSVYSDNWCTYVSAQAHELGHNLSLGHSGDPAGIGSQATYGDKSGMLGFSTSNDDGPIQCFNAPKNWQLGWYKDKQIPISFEGWEGNLIGLSDYGNSNVAEEDMVIAKADLNESYYVSFNRKTGINSGTLEGGDQVMVHKRDLGTNYGKSDVLAYLNSGESYTSPDTNFFVTVNDINLTSNPARANVKVERFDPPPPCYTGTVSALINPDPYHGETTWDIIDEAENVVASGDSTGKSNIVLGDGFYTFSIYDKYGDGICCKFGNGSYSFQVGSTVVKRGGEFGSQESTQFGICNNASSPPTMSPTSFPTATPTKFLKTPQSRSWLAINSNMIFLSLALCIVLFCLSFLIWKKKFYVKPNEGY
ncbi:hypothetical protein CTEN210_13047 [Chaetoceros tenuissimus]|uniref:Peptidase M11 gametolysin domain-containing protein n=1 Tax=Chaetoceros tenuissimus TaxID=426638 RepID=A0AAD3D4G0_9STRA|nr:hypothetical protein CTEN210_13047 [Chaetoceros tenuissimus]